MNDFRPMRGVAVDVSTVREVAFDLGSGNLVKDLRLVAHDPDSLHAPVIRC